TNSGSKPLVYGRIIGADDTKHCKSTLKKIIPGKTKHEPGGPLSTLHFGLLSRVIPVRLRCRGDETHRAFRQRGDGQAGIDAQIGCDHRPVADIHVLISENAVAIIHYAVLRRAADYSAPKTVGGAGNIEQY